MKKIFSRLLAPLLTLVALFTFTGCDEEEWNEIFIEGTWRVVEVSDFSATDYRPNDYITFNANGDFIAEGEPDLYERGYWELHGSAVYISFGYEDPEIKAIVRSINEDYLVLDVTDYEFGTYYTLRLVKDHYYYREAQ